MFLNDPRSSEIAGQRGKTRSVAAVDLWMPCLKTLSWWSVTRQPLCFACSKLAQGAPKPALIIGMPVGFVGAEAKQALWQAHRDLGIECITLWGAKVAVPRQRLAVCLIALPARVLVMTTVKGPLCI